MSHLSRSITCLCAIAILVISGTSLAMAQERTPEEAKNLQTVIDFYDTALNKMDAEGMLAYLGETYTNHNPNAKDGREGFKEYIVARKQRNPDARSEIKASFVEGNYVVLHVHAIREPGTRGNAIIDIFRLENAKIVEHWDAVQAIPEKSANNNTMF